VNTISPVFLVPIFTFFLNGEDKTSHPNFDNRLEVAEIVSDSVVGTWDEFTNKSLPFDEFKQKKGLQYTRTGEYPYTGYYVQLDERKRIRSLRHFIDGLLEGPVVSWRENGQKFLLGYYRNGEKHGVWTTWTDQNLKSLEQNYMAGKLDGLSTRWYKNGQKSSEQIFGNGKIISAIGWKPDGERCPSTRVVGGVGVLVVYDDYGRETKRSELEGIIGDRTIERYENGNVREEGKYENGKKNGLWIYYRPNGNEHFRITYRNGEPVSKAFSGSLGGR